MDFDQIVAKYPGERYQAYLGLLFYKHFRRSSVDLDQTPLKRILGPVVQN